jgi:hypothetical protein
MVVVELLFIVFQNTYFMLEETIKKHTLMVREFFVYL